MKSFEENYVRRHLSTLKRMRDSRIKRRNEQGVADDLSEEIFALDWAIRLYMGVRERENLTEYLEERKGDPKAEFISKLIHDSSEIF